jgi:exopolyphosphatase/guanosine-5'-triphosphate,3'-diphosphate pyrophosphatase
VVIVSEIVPRWEWRGFGDQFGPAEAAWAAQPPERVQESDEVYLLSSVGTDAVKIRDDLMDVKRLLAVNEDGLEQWVPVMKGDFPLPAGQVEAVFEALGVRVSSRLARTAYTLEELLEEVVAPNPDVRAVDVHKRRERHTVGGCMAEQTEVRSGPDSTRTVAIESEDAAQVIAAVRELGLAARPNVSFARGLKTLVGFGVDRFAIIDVGTNSVKFHIGERHMDGEWATVADRAATTRLGDELQETGRLGAAAMERTVEAIAGMAEEARQARVAAIAAVGTAGLRIAANSADFVSAVQARCGVTVEVISGEEEARLAYLGATAGIGQADGTRIVFDTGGGSSQFTFGRGGEVDERFSVDVGAVRYTEGFGLAGAVSEDVLRSALDAIAADLGRLDDRPTPDTLLAMGGAVTNLAAVSHGLEQYDPDVVQGTVLDVAEIDRQIELYRTRSAEERRAVVGLQPQRADIILAGACIVRTVLGKFGKDSLTVSDRALRHGLIRERFGLRSVAGP